MRRIICRAIRLPRFFHVVAAPPCVLWRTTTARSKQLESFFLPHDIDESDHAVVQRMFAMTGRTVVVLDYDEEWVRRFETLRTIIWPAVADVALRIEHVGSTSVPGLAAKPIVDMTILVADRAHVAPAVKRLATLGYLHRGNLGIADREVFDHAPDQPRHNLYVCPVGTIGIVNQLAVRDFLRAHPDVARAYGKLKKQLAARYPDDIESYVFGKTDFVLDVLRRAGLAEDTLAEIERVNRP